MTNITVITPPDILYNDIFSVLFVCPNITVKEHIHRTLEKNDIDLNIYVYDTHIEDSDIQWLINVVRQVNFTFIDVDNCDPETKNFVSFLISQKNTFYLTNDNRTPYNIINKNRCFDLTIIDQIFANQRGNNEQASKEQ